MLFGILQPKTVHKVPGTVHLYEDANAPTDNLKRHGDIILVPQPSDSPNDPLNWSTRKKDTVLFVICLASIMAES